MTAEIARYEDPGDLFVQRPAQLVPAQQELNQLVWIAQALSNTEFVPKGLRGKKEAVLAAMLSGREMGLGPMRALRQINVIDGKPSPEPELMMALALRAGHYIRVVETTHERCTVVVRRREWAKGDIERLTWDLDDAVRAELCTIDRNGRPVATSRKGDAKPWQTYTRAMLRSRCVSEACRAWLPDVTEGASYVPEEIGGGYDPDAGATVLDGAPDDLRAEVADAMEPAQSTPGWPGDEVDEEHQGMIAAVERRADKLVACGAITADRRAEAVAYARRLPGNARAMIARFDELDCDDDDQPDDTGDDDQPESVVVEVAGGFTPGEHADLTRYGVDRDMRHDLVQIVTGHRTAPDEDPIRSSNACTRAELDRILVLAECINTGDCNVAYGGASGTPRLVSNDGERLEPWTLDPIESAEDQS